VIVALKNGEIRMYNGKTLVDILKTDDQCNGILFGIFGREEGCLVVNTKSGGLLAKII
jgi:Bardet-Biedl syndrome 1 protein